MQLYLKIFILVICCQHYFVVFGINILISETCQTHVNDTAIEHKAFVASWIWNDRNNRSLESFYGISCIHKVDVVAEDDGKMYALNVNLEKTDCKILEVNSLADLAKCTAIRTVEYYSCFFVLFVSNMSQHLNASECVINHRTIVGGVTNLRD